MKLDTVNKLKARAKAIAVCVARHLTPEQGKVNDWAGFQNSQDLIVERLTDNHFRFKRNDLAYIDFKNFVPSGIERQTIHEPVLTGNPEVTDVSTTSIINQGTSRVTREYELSIEESKTMQHDVGTEITAGFKATLGTGALSPVKAELQVSASITANYKFSHGTTSKTTRKTKTKVQVEPNKVATVTTKRTISNFHQRCEYWSDIEHSIRIYSKDDWTHDFDSVAEFRKMLRGEASRDTPLAVEWRNQYTAIPSLTEVSVLTACPKCLVHMDKLITFKNAVTGDVTVTERDYLPVTS